MTETESTPGAAILVAIDIAKDHHEVLVERLSPPTRRRRFRIANALADFTRLAEYLRRLAAPVLIGFEATVISIGH
jgi:hypothetical protein